MKSFLAILFPKRLQLINAIAITYLALSLLVRISLYLITLDNIDFNFLNLLKVFGIGLFFDFGTLTYIYIIYGIYWMVLPRKLNGTLVDKIFVNTITFITLFALIFSFMGEFTFWDEFGKRYNFIAVDYLLYTYEVIQNINQSYPIPLLLLIIFSSIFGLIYWFKKLNIFSNIYNSTDIVYMKLIPFLIMALALQFYHYHVKNNEAEIFKNDYENELAKSGIYSFFSAYFANELDYNTFYPTLPEKEVTNNIRNLVLGPNETFTDKSTITRTINDIYRKKYPNVMFICMESMNASNMKHFGNEQNLTPFLDSIAKQGIFFTNLHATGNRTVRGMEAITLSIPPTPGTSIFKREKNRHMYNLATIFKEKGYRNTFFYGGDSRFDNMSGFYGFNGYDIVDKPNDPEEPKEFPTYRTTIKEHEVRFENAWGACDQDIFKKVIKQSNYYHKQGKPFFNFVMTNSNHKPYSFPDSIIPAPQGVSESAIQYADYSINEFFKAAQKEPWFKRTVFVFMADHCAFSAGRTEIDITKYHIPAIIYNLYKRKPREINKLCSQIDLFPTLFGYLHWSYKTKAFGRDIRKMKPHEERALIANQRKLGYMKANKVVILNDKKKFEFYKIDPITKQTTPEKTDSVFVKEAITYYQTAYSHFKRGWLIDENSYPKKGKIFNRKIATSK